MLTRREGRKGSMSEETLSFLRLFCALMLVKNAKATLPESMTLVPLVGKAKRLAAELASVD